MGQQFEQPAELRPTDLLAYPSFFEMGRTARTRIDAAKHAQKLHRLNKFVPSTVGETKATGQDKMQVTKVSKNGRGTSGLQQAGLKVGLNLKSPPMLNQDLLQESIMEAPPKRQVISVSRNEPRNTSESHSTPPQSKHSLTQPLSHYRMSALDKLQK